MTLRLSAFLASIAIALQAPLWAIIMGTFLGDVVHSGMPEYGGYFSFA